MTRLIARAASLLAVALMAAIAALLAAANASAESPFSFASTPGKLPKTVVPLHYVLDLKPDLDKLTFAGTEVVEIEVLEPTDRLLLNALDITVDEAAIDGEAGSATIASDEKAETVALGFARALTAGRHTLRISYGGKINRFGRGLFYVDYPVGDGKKRMISSHLEPAEARRIFPSWDEPAFKATIELTVTVAEKFLAVSNTPVAREEPVGEGLKRVAFEPTPRMSTYLFVLAAGELERLTGDADGVTVGVVTTAGKSARGRFALDSAIDLLKYYNDYFGVKYPLPKLDLIAVPGGFGGAMENWGGITFFESRLLVDANASFDARRGTLVILTHEMAHQWFGNLVTTAWWDNIWLNEGFASWMQSKAAEHLHPDWEIWLGASSAKQAAMAADARRTTHPIQQPVTNETEAMALFDVITYSKGQAFLRMLENYLGEDVFRDGVRQYLRTHAYSNATTADLWRALEAASGKPIASVAAAYTEQGGVPLVVARASCVDGEQRIALVQERFTIHDPEAKTQHWQVPIEIGPAGATQPTESVLVDGKAEIAAGRCGEPVKLNLGDGGYYRVQYDAATQDALSRAVSTMQPADRINFLTDTWALVEASRIEPVAYLKLLDYLVDDSNRSVWEQVIRTLVRIDHLSRERTGRAAFQAFARAKLRPVFDRVGWRPVRGEANGQTLLRTRLVRALGDFGDAEILAEAKRQFEAFLQDPETLARNLREPVIHLAGRSADRATYDTLIARGRKATNTDERVRYYSAAAGALDPALAKETLAIALTDELPTSMIGTLITWVADEHRELALDFVQANLDALASKQSPSFRNTFVPNLMANFSDPARAAELVRFAPAQETSGSRIISARAQERILTDADFVAHQLPAIDDWISRRGSGP